MNIFMNMLPILLRIIVFDGECIEEVSDVNSYNSDVVGTRYFVFVLILDSTIKLSRYYSGYS